nr:glycoside hydrolase family 6 protein [Nocardioides luti]
MKAKTEGGPAYKKIARRAQALWITDYYKKATVQDVVLNYAERANDANKTPLLSIYNIPDRDCGLYSSNDDQITDAYYKKWIAQVAAGVKGQHAIVVLEPDAVPFIGNPQCTGQGDRLGLLRRAARMLERAGAWVYLDAGHSGWQTPEHMAPLLKQAGIASARGFSTNIGNFRPTADEQAYATALVTELRKIGVKGTKYVIETGRNGGGTPPNGYDVCNPTWARLGKPPRLQFDGAFDGTLWVKNPGESDGPCNGGPDSGLWCDFLADRLLGRTPEADHC